MDIRDNAILLRGSTVRITNTLCRYLIKWKFSLQCNGFDSELQNNKSVSNQLHTNVSAPAFNSSD